MSSVRTLATLAVTAIVVALGGAAYADNIDHDGDTLTAGDQTSLGLGSIPCGATTSRTVQAWINKNGAGVNVYANNSTVTVTAASTNAVLAVESPRQIAIPNDWDLQANNFDSPRASFPVTVTPTVAGAGSATINLASSGVNSTGGSVARTDSISVTWTAGSCAPVKTATTTTVSCPSPVVYTGSPITAGCSASTTGTNGFTAVPTLEFTNNTVVGTAKVTATYDGDATHEPSLGVTTFVISKAASTTTLHCGSGPYTYTGGPLEPCTASVTGAALDTTVTPVYTNNTNAGSGASVRAEYAGDANHTASFDERTFTIGQAAPACTISGVTTTYDGDAHGLTGSCKGVGGQTLPGLDLGGTHKVAGSHTVTWSFEGGTNYADASGQATVVIERATSTVSLECPTSVVFTGAVRTPCTATVSGAGGLSEDITADIVYSTNRNVGTAGVSVMYAGGPNHEGSSSSDTFAITKATSTTTLTCDAGPFVYRGTAFEPCTATVTGAGGLDELVGVHYEDNIEAGTAGASAVYNGDDNHTGSSGSTTFTIDQAESVVTVTCPESVVYDGEEHADCTAKVTGAGGLNKNLDVTHTGDLINVGTVTGSASYAGDDNHTESSDSDSFEITKAGSTVEVRCDPSSVVYDGDAQEHCTAKVTGAGRLDVNLTDDIVYTDNVNAGTATAKATYDGDGNHTGDEDSATFQIEKAPSTTTVTCTGPVTFDNTAKTPCTASATGAGNLDVDLTDDVVYENNVNAGSASASATYDGDANHERSSDSESFSILKAGTDTTLTCPAHATYTGSALTPCTASVTGAGGLSVDLDPSYTNNTNAGTAGVSATYPESANHLTSSASTTFVIDKASSTVAITCPTSVVYTATERRVCSAEVTGAGGLKRDVDVSYSADATNVGTVTVTAVYDGDANHFGDDASATFEITQAPSTVTIACGVATYTGSPVTPCTATASGVGITAPITLTPAYEDNVAAGTAAKVGASWAGDRNHTASSSSTTFTIGKALSTVTVTCPVGPYYFTGSPITPACTARATGVGGLDVAVTPVTFTDHTKVGTATASAHYDGDANHLGGDGSTSFAISAWTLRGFYAPVDMGGVVNTVKAGSTVPLKFEMFAGTTELTETAAVKSVASVVSTCSATALEDAIEEIVTTGGTALRYDTSGGQYITNWKTPSQAGKCYKVTMTAIDGSSISAVFKLK